MSLFNSRTRGRPRSLFNADRFLSRDACVELLERIVRLSPSGWDISLHVYSRWAGNLRWARNEITTAGDLTNPLISVHASHRTKQAVFQINRLDEASIDSALAQIKHRMAMQAPSDVPRALRTSETYVETELWSDATYELDAAKRAALQQQLVGPALAEDLLSAGYLEVSAVGHGVVNSSGLLAYLPETRAAFSVTVRNATATGSGWAGVANKDWREIDAAKLSSIAIDKCKRSADPVAIEPGRYTVILEPQAVSDLMMPLIYSLARQPAEMGLGPWADRGQEVARSELIVGDTAAFDDVDMSLEAGGSGNSKIGQLVLDPRVTISADPGDPEAPFVPFASDGSPYRPVKWIEDGVLRELSYSRSYANRQLNKPDPLHNGNSFRMSGGSTSIEQMIAQTERGLLVTRLTNVRMVDLVSLLCTGTTSDGLWLIERGEITRPVKNFRFRESPLFAFNSLEALGTPVRVLQRMPVVVPPALIHDFSMTSLADAV